MLAVLLCDVLAGQGVSLPKPQGYVNDFANLLDAAHKAGLEQQLRQYDHQTGIEIAVLTVKTLQGETVEDFAQEVFKQWGIGKKGDNNGILFLIAPNPDRKLRIQTGYGMEPFLTDGQCGEILRTDVRPYTKKEQWQTGIEKGVSGIITTLGNRPLAELRRAEQQKQHQLDLEKNAREEVAIRTFGGIVFFGIVFYCVYWFRARKKLSQRIPLLASKCRESVEKERQRSRSILERVSELKRVYGPDLFESLWEKKVNQASQVCDALLEDIHKLENTMPFSLWGRSEVAYRLEGLKCFEIPKVCDFGPLEVRLEEVKKIASSAPGKLAVIPTQLAQAQGVINQPGTPQIASDWLSNANLEFEKATQLAQSSEPNWYEVGCVLTTCEQFISKACNAGSRGAKHFNDHTKKGGTVENYSQPRFLDDGSIYSERTHRSPSYESSSSSSSDFGSFGGGDSGGGGASCDA
jgi:uncharacterized membrane protein YgcG